jgi:hypothetical protein
MPRWHSPVLREPGKLVGIRPRRSSNLLLGVNLLVKIGKIIFTRYKEKKTLIYW